jgi:hypothetical protein
VFCFSSVQCVRVQYEVRTEVEPTVSTLQVTWRGLHVIASADRVQGGDVPFMIYDTDNLDKGWFLFRAL